MAYEIYWGAGSPYSWRAVLALEVMGLNYESKLLEFSSNEHRSPEMLAMNPRGQLPVLKDGQVSVYESTAILAYLDSKHPDFGLLGLSTEQTGKIWQTVFELENYVCGHILKIVQAVFFDDVADNIDAIEKAASYLYVEFKTLNTILEKSDFLVGDRISAVDIVLFPLLQAMLRALSLKAAKPLNLEFNQFDKKYPAIAKWTKRIEAFPGYSNSYPPNWND